MTMKTDEQLSHEHLLASTLEEFTRKLESVLTSYTDELHKVYTQTWSDIAEDQFTVSASKLAVPQQTQNLEKITHIIGFSNQPFMRFTINDKSFYVPANGTQQFDGIWYLSPGNPRYIEGGNVAGGIFTPATGALYLGLFGKEIPYGKVAF